jgi:phosphatidylglycerophosphate synthase
MRELFKSNLLPNYITGVRLIAAAILLVTTLFCVDHGLACFYPLFVVAGISDVLDGFVARKFDWCTELGARLDSISDLALYLSTLFFLECNFQSALSKCQLLLALGLVVQLFHLCVSFKRFGQFPAYHTDCARFCAYLVFFGVLLFVKTLAPQIIAILTGAWIACSIEGLIITAVLKRQAANLKGISEALMIK